MIGKKVNNYTLLKLIGSGGMADVYYAENNLGSPIAIKVLKKKFSDEEIIKSRFIKEAQITVNLTHPNIRKVIDLSEIDGQSCIVMEYLDGTTLRDIIGHSSLTSDKLKAYYQQCVRALEYTHERGIIHRDIKPSNIFITKDDQVKLLDFGISKTSDGTSHTITGQTLGTIMYMSPEQITDPKRVTAKTDLYSLGVTFYHALRGKPPYNVSTDSTFKIQTQIVKDDLPLSDVHNSYWGNTLALLLSKDPNIRKIQTDFKSVNIDLPVLTSAHSINKNLVKAEQTKVNTSYEYDETIADSDLTGTSISNSNIPSSYDGVMKKYFGEKNKNPYDSKLDLVIRWPFSMLSINVLHIVYFLLIPFLTEIDGPYVLGLPLLLVLLHIVKFNANHSWNFKMKLFYLVVIIPFISILLLYNYSYSHPILIIAILIFFPLFFLSFTSLESTYNYFIPVAYFSLLILIPSFCLALGSIIGGVKLFIIYMSLNFIVLYYFLSQIRIKNMS